MPHHHSPSHLHTRLAARRLIQVPRPAPSTTGAVLRHTEWAGHPHNFIVLRLPKNKKNQHCCWGFLFFNKKLASIETSHRYSPGLAVRVWSKYHAEVASDQCDWAALRLGGTPLKYFVRKTLKTKKPQSFHFEVLFFNKKLAFTYSPRFDPSTIGGAGLNCSVRNGKRCSPALSTPWRSLIFLFHSSQ